MSTFCEDSGPRMLAWFSCGDASAVACALALKQHPRPVVARIVIPSEHPDNDRFAADCARWFGCDIVELRSSEYADTWDVWESRRYIAGIAGAPCTTELKKEGRGAYLDARSRQATLQAGNGSRRGDDVN